MSRSPAAAAACWQRIVRLAQAAADNTPTLVPALNQARDGGYPRAGDGQPGGKGGHRDLSDRLRYTPEVKDANGLVVSGGDLAAHQDLAERDLAELDRLTNRVEFDLLAVARIAERNLREPASANLCRGGCCPDGNLAAKGKKGRCSACSQFWYAISNPAERYEREFWGQPHGVSRGLQMREQVA